MALSFLITTFSLAMIMEPFARLAVIIIGSISGVNPTPTLKANTPASNQSPSVKPLDKENDGHHDQHQTNQEPRDTVHLPFKRSGLVIGVQSLLDGPHHGIITNRQNHGLGTTRQDIGSHKAKRFGF